MLQAPKSVKKDQPTVASLPAYESEQVCSIVEPDFWVADRHANYRATTHKGDIIILSQLTEADLTQNEIQPYQGRWKLSYFPTELHIYGAPVTKGEQTITALDESGHTNEITLTYTIAQDGGYFNWKYSSIRSRPHAEVLVNANGEGGVEREEVYITQPYVCRLDIQRIEDNLQPCSPDTRGLYINLKIIHENPNKCIECIQLDFDVNGLLLEASYRIEGNEKGVQRCFAKIPATRKDAVYKAGSPEAEQLCTRVSGVDTRFAAINYQQLSELVFASIQADKPFELFRGWLAKGAFRQIGVKSATSAAWAVETHS